MGKPLLGRAQLLLGTGALVCTSLALLLSLIGNLLTFVTPLEANPYLDFNTEVRERLAWIPAFGIVGLLLSLGPLILFARGPRRTRLLRQLVKNTPGWTGLVALALILYSLITFVWFVSLLDDTREPARSKMVDFRWDVQRLRAFTSGWMALYWPAILGAYQIRRAARASLARDAARPGLTVFDGHLEEALSKFNERNQSHAEETQTVRNASPRAMGEESLRLRFRLR